MVPPCLPTHTGASNNECPLSTSGVPLMPTPWCPSHRLRVPRHWREVVRVDRETGVHQRDESGHDVANVDGLAVVPLGDLQLRRWHTLLPPEAHVGAEDNDR